MRESLDREGGEPESVPSVQGAGLAGEMTFRVYQHMQNVHSHAFDEVARGLVEALKELGHECDYSETHFKQSASNIVLGPHLLTPAKLAAFKGHVIVYQMEQLSESSPWWTPEYREVLWRADVVWDMSSVNVEFLKRHGIKAHHVPLGWSAANETIRRDQVKEKDVDLLFYGSMNKRRSQFLADVETTPLRLKKLFGVYGAERDAWIARSKAVLNLHFYDVGLMEQPRVAYLLNNGVQVLSEEAQDNPWPMIHLDGPLYVRHGHDNFADRAIHQVIFRDQYPMKKFLKAVL